MLKYKTTTPVCLIIFKRAELTQRLFDVVRQVQPSKLLVIADGPRLNWSAEAQKCEETRKIIDTVDWDCEVLKNYADQNLGLKHRVASGLDWVFETVEEAIILEDDCLPNVTFFRFCDELLSYYRNTEEVMVITGTNFFFGYQPTPENYYFSRYIDCWGWATWRRAWQHFDFDMQEWPRLREQNWLQELFLEPQVVAQWTNIFEATYQGYINSWAYRWKFACWRRNGLTIVPEKNLVSNLGFNQEGTNTQLSGGLLDEIPNESIVFPLKHPAQVERNDWVDYLTQKIVFELCFSILIPELVTTFWNFTESQIEKTYLTIIKGLRNSWNVKPLVPTCINDQKRQEINTMITTNTENKSKEIQSLLVAMLYAYPHQLPIQYDWSRIPQWLLPDYINFSFTPPGLYQEIGEAKQYLSYLECWMNYISSIIENNPGSQIAQQILYYFQKSSNCRGLYQTDANLKNLYTKRAKLIEKWCLLQGQSVDYDFAPRLPERTRIRLGILADNFGLKPDTFLSLPAYKHLNRDRFEIVLYSIQATGDRLERYCSGHADIGVQLPEDLPSTIQKIREEDLDILLIAGTITEEVNNLSVLTNFRLARIQILGSYSGLNPQTSTIDYYLSGDLLELEKTDDSMICLSGIGKTIDFGCEQRGLPIRSFDRETLGISNHAVVYVYGEDNQAIPPEVEQTWVKILSEVPDSVLLLYSSISRPVPKMLLAAWKQRLQMTLKQQNINEDRVIWVSGVRSHTDIQALLKQADIYLSPYPYTDLVSLVEPFLTNLPVVVMEGKHSHTRLGAALLEEMEMSSWISKDEAAYLETAVSLGKDFQLREQYGHQIQQAMKKTPCFLDSELYSSEIESRLVEVFENYQLSEIKENLRLRRVNLIIFPDWSQPEDILLLDLAMAFKATMSHGQKDDITLLVATSNISDEDADAAISTVIMGLLMEEESDLAEGLEICLTGSLGRLQLQALYPQLQGRLSLEYESSIPELLFSAPAYSLKEFLEMQF
ncbi:MAG: hypothetical protein J7545_17885 [Roseofilum sp. SBFL]|uniref:O-linked N-acetylglucosamine transferase family protein n=1 Tax=unclassified Roseofilum TaxID=2620099 RepID=UPI001AFF265E|nr:MULTISPECIES: hypothetical protein [unclassified Roseofilum]MBP0015851.1 hypothetical protein [Roseofilum sp. SID3]MBP0025411.1 hypothetical protein [Roseofilum sp. SID2]MBP0038673.1 hypothetical protein [Roseofilum sp. SID1]MBP0043819.1 hypothetical protein [Roseofilum sp. SBFL]